MPGPATTSSTGLGSPTAGLVAPALAYYDVAPWLAIGSAPPSVVTAGQPFDITVEVENSDGSLDANFTGSLTIGLENDPGGAILGGTLTEPAVDGYATFTGLTLTQAGEGYTILAVSGGGPAAATIAPFAVTAAAPAPTWSNPSQHLAPYRSRSWTPTATSRPHSRAASPSSWARTPDLPGRLTTRNSPGRPAPASPPSAHLKSTGSSHSRIFQATADGITASAVLATPERNAARWAHVQIRTDRVKANPPAYRRGHRSPVH